MEGINRTGECTVHLKSGQSFESIPGVAPLRLSSSPSSLSQLKTSVSQHLGDTPSPPDIVLAREEGGGLLQLNEGVVSSLKEETLFVFSTKSWKAFAVIQSASSSPKDRRKAIVDAFSSHDDASFLRQLRQGQQASLEDNTAVQDARKRLAERAALFGLQENPDIDQKGDCQFDAAADQLRKYHFVETKETVRARVVRWIRENAGRDLAHDTSLRMWILALPKEEYSSFDDYLEKMARAKWWGDEVTLLAICESYEVAIVMLSSVQGGNWHRVLYPAGKSEKDELPLLWLGHEHERHYWSLVSQGQQSKKPDPKLHDVPLSWSTCLSLWVLLFPKEFEFWKFIRYLQRRQLFITLAPDALQKVDVTWGDDSPKLIVALAQTETGELIGYRCLVNCGSDYSFAQVLTVGLLSDVYSPTNVFAESKERPPLQNHFLLIGSCGSTDISDIGKMHSISCARKIDCGIYNLDGKLTELGKRPLECPLQKFEISCGEPRDIFSVTSLNENCLGEEFQNATLWDMETYEFASIARAHVMCRRPLVTGCFRFVTDKVSTFPFTPDFVIQNNDDSRSYDLATYVNYFTHQTFDIDDAPKILAHLCDAPGVPAEKRLAHVKKFIRMTICVNFEAITSLVNETRLLDRFGPRRYRKEDLEPTTRPLASVHTDLTRGLELWKSRMEILRKRYPSVFRADASTAQHVQLVDFFASLHFEDLPDGQFLRDVAQAKQSFPVNAPKLALEALSGFIAQNRSFSLRMLASFERAVRAKIVARCWPKDLPFPPPLFDSCDQEHRDRDAITSVLMEQQNAWNQGDQESFLQGYFEDATLFEKDRVVRGRTEMERRYPKDYPDKAAMGRLKFSSLEFQFFGQNLALVLGHWHLKRADEVKGVFTLVWRRFPEGWRIVHDHRSEVKSDLPPRSSVGSTSMRVERSGEYYGPSLGGDSEKAVSVSFFWDFVPRGSARVPFNATLQEAFDLASPCIFARDSATVLLDDMQVSILIPNPASNPMMASFQPWNTPGSKKLWAFSEAFGLDPSKLKLLKCGACRRMRYLSSSQQKSGKRCMECVYEKTKK